MPSAKKKNNVKCRKRKKLQVAPPTAPGLASIFDSLAHGDLEVLGDEFAMVLTEDSGVCNKRQKTSFSA